MTCIGNRGSTPSSSCDVASRTGRKAREERQQSSCDGRRGDLQSFVECAETRKGVRDGYICRERVRRIEAHRCRARRRRSPGSALGCDRPATGKEADGQQGKNYRAVDAVQRRTSLIAVVVGDQAPCPRRDRQMQACFESLRSPEELDIIARVARSHCPAAAWVSQKPVVALVEPEERAIPEPSPF